MSPQDGGKQAPEDQEASEQARPTPTLAMQNTPNAEKYVLEADAMRRRQMRSALLHGSRRTWREHQRVWPAVVVGVIVIGVIVAGFAVLDAFRVTRDNQREMEREREQPPATAPVEPGGESPPPEQEQEPAPEAEVPPGTEVPEGG
ncbi:hypothetical protein [Aeromicrobium sp. CTD01-1L150]|uniref:hypothetical protein n=1 Tax=Aeromicrobium sp. CTD01-1L150 TaxID=3341830 RepID=UPI0035BEE8D2